MIRYSNSPPVDVLYTNDGTKANIITNITQALGNAGWTSVGTNQYQSAITNSGFKIRVDVIDGGMCVHLRLRSPTVTSTGHIDGAFILPVNNRTFRIIANQYQLFHFLTGSDVTTDPSDVAFGVPWTPSFIIDLQDNANTIDQWMGWMVANGIADPPSGANSQTTLCYRGRLPQMSGGRGSMWIWDTVAFYDASNGDVTYIICQMANAYTGGFSTDDRSAYWEDGSVAVYEPYIAWPSGHATSGNWSPVQRKGQIWDAIVYGDRLPSEVVKGFDSRRWRNVTIPTTLGGYQVPHSLLLLTN